MSSLRDAMSHAALGWVKPELDETLRQVRNEVEDDADVQRAHVMLKLSLGHEPSDEEVAKHMAAAMGERGIRGVVGDLFSTRTYRDFQAAPSTPEERRAGKERRWGRLLSKHKRTEGR